MKNYRALFPVTERYIYLNHAANSPEPLPVLKAMGEYLQACSQCGTVMEKEWQEVPSRVRESFARLLECPSSNVAFLPNVSAAINLVAGGLDWRPGDNIIVALISFLPTSTRGCFCRMPAWRSAQPIGKPMDWWIQSGKWWISAPGL